MPFVTINILNGKSKDYIQKVTDTINDAVIETMNFPEDDRYQVVHELPSHCLQYQGRDEDRIMMHLVMRAGRPDKAKQAFYFSMPNLPKAAPCQGILFKEPNPYAGSRPRDIIGLYRKHSRALDFVLCYSLALDFRLILVVLWIEMTRYRSVGVK